MCLLVQVSLIRLVCFRTSAQVILVFLDATKDGRLQPHPVKRDAQGNALYII